ncbi:bifunctional UDP-N-acetylglucosamine diphosphorylase/glucosamine-1-phosphate N-acetyltransferase GlmU [Brevibacillus choshinensis]|uniref:Bifunctional UDP-N-acetylglucosamine diphosphorylase/glucosamine-1-phosphate N-acetyltransferase GlmU n=1 Tax=Brevibacillus choshinensis TaxID=54911 RepID=A0ABX7FT50_BRECH|nr:bifunctional UDP-N-acetylglucosamine diphosphorylase/glucosamine-1-phosphate N-acetyltransferase GlmU [Brevibacillus choshinensis]QRG68930.1 bifunctional UDP-N-acetylglucosamine diphosphorylase/glucosamine-1-phosphate N-acetyltransferase GlmU [Brevibacillus choshinensis]
MNIHAVILAAGKGTRMKSRLYKVMHPVCGKPMIEHVVEAVEDLALHKLVVVIGHGAEAVMHQLGDRVTYAHQQEQLGTAHAVWMCREALENQEGVTLVLNGDTPLVRKETLHELLSYHRERGAAATVLTAVVDNPTGYGRIIRDESGDVRRIVEEKDATLGQKKVCEISTGIFCFDNRKLFETLPLVSNENAQGEYYLPDVLSILQDQGCLISAFVADDPDEGAGVNDRIQLAQMEQKLRKRINERHMSHGVTIIDPVSTYIDSDVQIASDTVIYPGSYLSGRTRIAEGCAIGPNAHVMDSVIESHVQVSSSTVVGSKIPQDSIIGPYAFVSGETGVQEDRGHERRLPRENMLATAQAAGGRC